MHETEEHAPALVDAAGEGGGFAPADDEFVAGEGPTEPGSALEQATRTTSDAMKNAVSAGVVRAMGSPL
jgi:hypothetical protein